MTSVDPTLTTTLLANVRRLGLTHTAESLDDLIARATRSRWSPTVLLDTLVQAELEARARRRLERLFVLGPEDGDASAAPGAGGRRSAARSRKAPH